MHTLSDIAPPRDPSGRDFEEFCLAVYTHHFETRDAMYYNRGHGQHGIDIMLLERPSKRRARKIVIQCKDVERLPPSAIAPDLRQALIHWAPGSDAEDDLLVIVATTARRPPSGNIMQVFQDLRAELVAEPLRDRVGVLVHGWDDITAIILRYAELQDHLRARGQYDPPDEPLSYQHLAESIQHCVDARQLAEARQHWNQAVAMVGKDALPRTLLGATVSLLLAAGDFARLDDTLAVSLTRRTVSAGGLVAHFRARRFTSSVPQHPVGFADLVTKDLPPLRLGDLVGKNERYLLSAYGNLDDKLTLALWLVMHGGPEAAARGLLRALSLIRQHWPAGCEMPDPNETWTLLEGRLVRHGLRPRASRFQPATSDERKAVVLTHAFEFLRACYATRFGWQSTWRVEADCGGWTHFLPDSDTDKRTDALEYFALYGACDAGFDARAQFNAAELGGFIEEALRMMADWMVVCQTYQRGSGGALPYGGVCTAQVLLWDAETGQGGTRCRELRLSAPSLAVEHVLAVMSMLEIADAAERRDGLGDKNLHAWRLSQLRQMLLRMTRRMDEPIPDERIRVRAVYSDLGGQRVAASTLSHELHAAIAMSSDFWPLIATYIEAEQASASGASKISMYWIWNEAEVRSDCHPDSHWCKNCVTRTCPNLTDTTLAGQGRVGFVGNQ